MLSTTTITDLNSQHGALRMRRHGVIDVRAGRLLRIELRPWPKLLSLPEVWSVPWKYHKRGRADRCLLYYNQPRRFPSFLSLKYVVTTHGTTYKSFRMALRVLDAIAAAKRIDAILCDAANTRISDRLLARFGWQSHKPQRFHRNYIKRLYGEYPADALALLDSPPMCDKPLARPASIAATVDV